MSEVVAFPITPFDGFDAHAWIREVEAAGAILRPLDDESWSIEATTDVNRRYVDAISGRLAEVGGESLEARARSGAIHRALRWRAAKPREEGTG